MLKPSKSRLITRITTFQDYENKESLKNQDAFNLTLDREISKITSTPIQINTKFESASNKFVLEYINWKRKKGASHRVIELLSLS